MKGQVSILGATGFTGKELVQQAISRGYKVKILVRDVNKLGDLASQVEIVKGAYFDHEKIDKAIEGSSAVLSTIGPALNAKSKDVDVPEFHKAMKHLLNRIESKGIGKFINISGAGIAYPDEKLPLPRKLMRVLLKMTSGPVARVKDGEVALLYDSRVRFVNVRPPLIKETDGVIKAHESNLQGMSVGVKQLCSFMLDYIEDSEWDRKAPVVGIKKK